jgi:tRNA A-37 threonylcarbamoyl transferase component Bud32
MSFVLPEDFEPKLVQQGYDEKLVHALVLLYETLKVKCNEKRKHSMLSMMCSVSNPPDIEGEAFADGQYGSIYKTLYNGKPVIIKTSKVFNVDMIREVFINMIIINSFLLQDFLHSNLIATCGLYNTLQDNELYINMIQLYVDGDTLYERLIKNGITLEQLKDVIGQVFSTLTILHESPFQLRHNDLHTKNIIITTTNRAYIIDFGLATFTYGKFYDLKDDNTLEQHYYHYEDYRNICALDMFHIFYTIKDNASKAEDTPLRNEIIAYATNMLNVLVYQHFYESVSFDSNHNFQFHHIKLDHMITIIGYDEEPIRDINWFYYLLDGIDKKAPFSLRGEIHKQNISLLKKMTYRWFLENYCIETGYNINWKYIDDIIRRFKPIIPLLTVRDPSANTGMKKRRNSPKKLKNSPKKVKKNIDNKQHRNHKKSRMRKPKNI